MKRKLLAFAPGIVLGLYIGRVLGELWAIRSGATPLPLTLAITAAAVSISVYLLRILPFSRSWPFILLLIYVFYPEANLTTALVTGILIALISWLIPRRNGQRSTSSASALWTALFLALLFFVLYQVTLAPDLLPADNGEFQIVAANLGVAHPPGFPLYTMLAHIMTLMPIGPTPAYRVNLLSAITSAITLALVYGAVFILTKRHLGSILAVVALGTATTIWAQATTANIRSLSALFTALLFLILLLYYQRTSYSQTVLNSHSNDRYLISFALFLALGISHHASLAFIGLIGTIFILLIDPALLRSPRRWWKPLLTFLIALLPLLYLPLRATSGARGASPDLATWSGFIEHIFALGFRGDLFTYLQPALLWERLRVMGNVLSFQFEPLLLLGMLLGLLILVRRDWRLAFLIGGSFALHTLITATYRAPQTVEYMLPAYIPLALLLGIAVGDPSIPWSKVQVRGIYLPLREILATLLLLAALQQFMRNLPSYRWLHQDETARDYAQSLLAAAPLDAVILSDWHWVTPLWYLQEVEGRRPDVTVRFVFPEGESYAATWARRIGEELTAGRAVISTHLEPGAFASLPAPEPLLEAFLFRQDPAESMPAEYTPLDHTLGDRLRLLGYQVMEETTQVGQEAVVNLAWQPTAEFDGQTSLFAHLSAADGQVYAQQDITLQAQPEGITLTQFRLAPRLDAQPGNYTLQIGAYDTAPLLDSMGNDRIQLEEVTITSRSLPQVTRNPLQRTLSGEEGRQLVGYDWDNTVAGQQRLYLHWRTPEGYQTEVRDGETGALPPFIGPWGVPSRRWSHVTEPQSGFYVPFGHGIVWTGDQLDGQKAVAAGQSLTLEQQFLSSQPVMRDYAVSVRLIGYEEDGYHWAWWDLDDGIPAMGAIPTLKWIAGSKIRAPHFVQVADNTRPEQKIGAALNLYDAFTNRILPILDERITADYAWVPLGTTAVASE